MISIKAVMHSRSVLISQHGLYNTHKQSCNIVTSIIRPKCAILKTLTFDIWKIHEKYSQTKWQTTYLLTSRSFTRIIWTLTSPNANFTLTLSLYITVLAKCYFDTVPCLLMFYLLRGFLFVLLALFYRFLFTYTFCYKISLLCVCMCLVQE